MARVRWWFQPGMRKVTIDYDNFFLANGTAYAAGGLWELAVEALR
jgi:uncharacterized protein VirK/YbjX